MALQFDQLNNQLKTNDSTNANAPLVLTPAGTGSVLLNGTGTNLLQQSQALATSPWSTSNGLTVTNNFATAPNGTTTASKLAEPAATTNFFQSIQNPSGAVPSAVYTYSFYAKAAERTQVFAGNSVSSYQVIFDLSAGTIVSAGFANYISSAIFNAGNGWYRCSVVFTASASANPFYSFIGIAVAGSVTYTSTLGSGILVWGAQLELGSTANTYVPTTTAAIYNAPQLSFSGVASIGLQSDGSLYAQPAGTGALQAQATTSTTAGGNARGANSVDWQMSRTSASQVANGTQSVIGGGSNNTSSGYASTTAGGELNSCSAYNGFIGAGSGNTLGSNSQRSVIVGGVSNTANGFLNFIGGGAFNSSTSGSAVTSQSGTMNGTTAVTLSASNANIKVGQVITGTSIQVFPYTYVAAISGTSLTLSQNATGSTTNNIFFFTPHGVVVGGGNNQATGSYSFIGGGGDAGTAANRNVASGDFSTVVGGQKNTASGYGSFIGGGFTNSATIDGAVVVGGGTYGANGFVSNNATNTSTFVGAGLGNLANGSYSAIMGGVFGTTRGIVGNHVFPACNIPLANGAGYSQSALLVLGRQTTNATATVLTSDTLSANTLNQVILPNNSAYYFKVSVIAGVTGGGNTKAWTLEGAIKRGANAGSTAIVGTVTTTIVAADAGASTWTVTATADTTNGGLAITFTGQAATTIRVVAKAETTEMTY